MRITLHEGWTVRAVGGKCPSWLVGVDVPAAVPGSVHQDLMAADLIPDPYLDRNEELLAWVGRVDWSYQTTFDWPVGDHIRRSDDSFHVRRSDDGGGRQVDLVAEGLDTVAQIRLNDEELASTRNMHRTYRIPVAHLLRPGPNTLTVRFAAPVPAAEQASRELGPRPHVNTHPYNALRKMACNYGWDWGPELVTVGIWRPIGLETWDTARIASVRPLVDVDGGTGRLTVHIKVQRDRAVSSDLPVSVTVAGPVTATSAPGGSGPLTVEAVIPAGADEIAVALAVPNVALWWPRGYGEQPRYDVEVRITDPGTAMVVHGWTGRVGFRTVGLDTSPDEHGTSFALSVNGAPVFARGVNWIPDDCFPARVDAARYHRRLQQACDANVNLIRVWGGGIYESDIFYDRCDELGLLVWQDFLFACAAYAEEEPLRGEVVAEATEAVTRLSPHPSLVLWNGGNENIWGHEDWGWKPALGERTWGWGYYTDVLPGIVGTLDPTRPYTPGSPYSFRDGTHPNDPDHGTLHIWDVWNQVDYTVYRTYRPRFVAEFGFQGPPTWATLVRAIPEDSRDSDSAAMLTHQKADDGNAKLARGLAPHLPTPVDFDDWHWATSLNQARAMTVGIEHLRALGPHCGGAVVWQLNDCWPVTSWAAIDGDGRLKPLWYALRRSFANRLLTIQPCGGGLTLVLVNDSDGSWSDTVRLNRFDVGGDCLAGTALPVTVAPRSTVSVEVPEAIAVAGNRRRELVEASAGVGGTGVIGDAVLRAHWFFVPDVDSELPDPAAEVTVEAIAGGYRVDVIAISLLRDLAVLADRAAPDAVVDDMLVTLLPGQRASFTVTTGESLPSTAFTDPRVLRSANQLVAAARTGHPRG
jgi:beta-mannosidase